MKKFLVTGTSGTGKTTLAEELKRKGFFTISIDEVHGLCSWIDINTGANHGGKEADMTKEFVDQHDWILNIEMLQNMIAVSGKEEVFVFGMATNQKDFIHIFDKVILLYCEPEIFSRRIKQRKGNRFGQDSEVLEQVINRSKAYKKEMESIDATVIDASKPLDKVVNDLIAITR